MMHTWGALISIVCLMGQSSAIQRETFEPYNHHKINSLVPATDQQKQQSTLWPMSSSSPVVSETHSASTFEFESASSSPSTSSRGHSILVNPANNQVQSSDYQQQQHQLFKDKETWRHHLDTHHQRSSNSLDLNTRQQQEHHQRRYQSSASKQPRLSKNHGAPYQQVDQVDHQQAYFHLPSNLELALKQASGDESVFQPAPTIGHAHVRNWAPQSPATQMGAAVADQLATVESTSSTATPKEAREIEASRIVVASVQLPPTQALAKAPTAMMITTTAATTSTTEMSNSVVTSNHGEPLVVLSHQDSMLQMGHNHVQQKEYETNSNTSARLQPAATIEFNNQVIYEGPATAPPPMRHSQPPPSPGDDFYFSATAKTNKNANNYNNEHANSNAWWAIGAGGEFERASNLTRDDYLEYCDKSPLLVNGKQRGLCRMHPRVMPVVARGIKMAIDECQTRFAHSRWNCSLILAQNLPPPIANEQHDTSDQTSNQLTASGSSHSKSSGGQIFGEVMRHPNRERSLLNALFAAALAHSMTKACSQGELPEECSCDRKIKSKNNRGRVEWVACSDDIDYGARFSRDFTDNFDSDELDAIATIYMHNNEVGRRVFKSATDITCTCLNGENGLCQTKRCWKHLGPFADVVDEIIRRYEAATHVQRSNKDPNKLRPVRRGVRKPKRKDLVYIDESPDYCQQDLRIGVLGTQSRSCNSTSQDQDSCSLLCCGRGFRRVVEHVEEDCNCKFVWCCQVKCDKCSRLVTNDICN